MHTVAAPRLVFPPLGSDLMSISQEEAGALLRRKREALGMTQEQVVDLAGIPTVTQLSQYEKGRVNAARSKYLPALARVLKLTDAEVKSINPSAVFETPFIVESGKGQARKYALIPVDQALDSLPFTMLPIYDLAQASKPLNEIDPIPELSPVAVANEDLRPGLVVFRVRGDSMVAGADGGISEGDTIYVDTHDLNASPEGVYVIHIPGNGVTIKRVRLLGGEPWLFSDSPDQEQHPPFRAEEARVVGRVYEVFRRVRAKLGFRNG